MFLGPAEPDAPELDGADDPEEEPFVDGRFVKSNENTIESSFTAFNSNPGRFALFRSNSL
jgi:hypothetical protein